MITKMAIQVRSGSAFSFPSWLRLCHSWSSSLRCCQVFCLCSRLAFQLSSACSCSDRCRMRSCAVAAPGMPRTWRAVPSWRFSNLRLVAHVPCATDTALNEPAILRAKLHCLLFWFLSLVFDVPAGLMSPKCIGPSLLHRSTHCSQMPKQANKVLLFR